MKTLIIYHSEHHMNTEKVAKVIATVLEAELVRSQNIKVSDVKEYDLVGFGSGIYHGKFHENLRNWIEILPVQDAKRAFLFSTTGSKTYSERAHDMFKAILKEKGFTVLGEFSCLGFDTALSSEGINKGRPDAQDLEEAESFAKGLKNM